MSEEHNSELISEKVIAEIEEKIKPGWAMINPQIRVKKENSL